MDLGVSVRKRVVWTGGLTVLLHLFALNTSALTQGGEAGAFLRLGLGARAKALGNAYSALARSVEATYYNPAGLPFIQDKEILASYRFLALDRQFTFVGFGMPISPEVGPDQTTVNGGFSLSWLRAGVNDIDGRNTDGQHFDDLSNDENAFMFAFALSPWSRLSVGLTVKVLWNRFPNLGNDGQTISSTGVGFDLGVMVFPAEWLALGATIKEINSRYRWNTEDLFGEDGSETINKFPKIIRYGVAISPPQLKNVTFVFDYEQMYREKLLSSKIADRYHAGVEAVFLQDVVVRAGFDDGTITAGGGYEFSLVGKKSQLNYAFVSASDRPEDEHVFTWVFRL